MGIASTVTMTGVARLAAMFRPGTHGTQDPREMDEGEIRIARARRAARAEIDVFLAVHEASSFAPAKCAALVRAWGALASMEALVPRSAIPSATPCELPTGEPGPAVVPRVLADTPDDFVARVLACAESDPWGDVVEPSERQLDGHRSALVRAFAGLDRRVTRRPLATGLSWPVLRRVSAAALVVALAAVSVGFALYRPKWRASYYANDALSGEPSIVSRTLEADHYWGPGGPGVGLPTDHFSARFETCLVTERPETFVFTVGSDDGSRLLIDERSVIDAWSDQVYAERGRAISLDAGVHTLRLEYYERTGQARLTFAGRIERSGADVTGMLRLPGERSGCTR
jgi:hypothetical protein